jgi:hypothetical protein
VSGSRKMAPLSGGAKSERKYDTHRNNVYRGTTIPVPPCDFQPKICARAPGRNAETPCVRSCMKFNVFRPFCFDGARSAAL